MTIRLAPVLPTTVAAVHFPDVQKATEAVHDVMRYGVGIRALLTSRYYNSSLLDCRMCRINGLKFYARNQPAWPIPA